MDSNLKRSIILDHYQNPRNKGLTDDSGYVSVNMNSESCIDEVNIMAKIENDRIVDIKYDGEACAICTSSTSIMTETLIGKTLEEAREIVNNFDNMINEKDILESAIVYDDIYRQPNRKKCALLSWWGIEKIINKGE